MNIAIMSVAMPPTLVATSDKLDKSVVREAAAGAGLDSMKARDAKASPFNFKIFDFIVAII